MQKGSHGQWNNLLVGGNVEIVMTRVLLIDIGNVPSINCIQYQALHAEQTCLFEKE